LAHAQHFSEYLQLPDKCLFCKQQLYIFIMLLVACNLKQVPLSSHWQYAACQAGVASKRRQAAKISAAIINPTSSDLKALTAETAAAERLVCLRGYRVLGVYIVGHGVHLGPDMV
jgi:hypothetical protein